MITLRVCPVAPITIGGAGVAAWVQAEKTGVVALSPAALVAATWKAYWALICKPPP